MNTPAPIIEFRAFEKRYGRIHAVKPLNLSIRAGETFALLGPNGSGKSTLIRALVGLYAPTAGCITVNGADISARPQAVQRQIAYMPQRITMPGQLTAREVLLFFAGLRGVDARRVDELLDFVDLAADADRYTREFSGGMLQRLGLAVAFLEEVPVYVLDEPTLNLDPVGADRFRARIQELKRRGATVVFSSHILQDAVQLADRVGILVEGRLVRVEPMAVFRDLVVQETRVRVVLEKASEAVVSAAARAGAQTASANGRQYSFKAPPSRRLDIIRAIEAAGGKIQEFHTEIPDWEMLTKKQPCEEDTR